MTLREARTAYRRILRANASDDEAVRAGRFHSERGGADAKRHKGWVDFLDKLVREGELSRLQAEYADNFNTFMPKNDQDFVLTKLGVRLSSEPIDERSDDVMDGNRMTHYVCTLTRQMHVHTFYYSMGSAHTEPPSVGDVMFSMLMDAAMLENVHSPEEFAAEFAEDPDDTAAVTRAKNQYYGCVRQRMALNRMFSRDMVYQLYELFTDY